MGATKTKLRMTDGCVDRLRVEVIDGDLAGQGDRPAMAVFDQSTEETRGVLAAGDASELEILSAQEHSRMQCHEVNESALQGRIAKLLELLKSGFVAHRHSLLPLMG